MLMLLVMNVSVEFLAQVDTKNLAQGPITICIMAHWTVSVVGFDVNLA